MHLIARSKAETMIDRVADALHQVEGAYSLVFLSPDELVAVRDPYGFRPLCLGQLDDAYVIASEPPAFQLIGAKFIRDIKPGEMVVVNKLGLQSLRPFRTSAERRYMCIFEYVYFSRGRTLPLTGSASTTPASAWGVLCGKTSRSKRTSWCPCPIAASRRRSGMRKLRVSRSS